MALILHYRSKGRYGIKCTTGFSKGLQAAGRTVPGMEYIGDATWAGHVDAVKVVVKLLQARGLRVAVKNPIPPADETPNPTAPISFAPSRTKKPFRQYQRLGASWLVSHADDGCLLADDLGLGKSMQALRAARALRQRTLIVCPSFVRGVWGANESSQIREWWPEAWPPVVLEGVKPEGEGKKVKEAYTRLISGNFLVVSCHYDILYAWAELLKGRVKTVIFDEARFLQSEKSRRSIAAKIITEETDPDTKERRIICPHRMGLDGTPVTDHTSQLWNVLDTLSPGRFGKPFSFYLRYCGAHREQITFAEPGDGVYSEKVTPPRTVWKFDGLTNAEELHDRLGYMMLRRTKTDVAMELPPRTRDVVEVEVDEKYCIGPDAALRSDVNLRKALDLAADGKLPEGKALIKNHASNGRRIVVFTHRVAVCEEVCLEMRAAGFESEFIHGGVSQKNRLARYESKSCRILVANMDCVAGGIDLSHYDVDVFLELDYNPQKVIQCSGRLYRFGQTKNVLEQFIIGRGTIDELIRDRMVKKLDLYERVVGKMDDDLKQKLEKDSRQAGAADLRRFWESLQEE